MRHLIVFMSLVLLFTACKKNDTATSTIKPYYVLGVQENSSFLGSAVLWKDSTRTVVQADEGNYARPIDMQLVGNDVYALVNHRGSTGARVFRVLKNSTVLFDIPFADKDIFSIAVNGSDVYLVGYTAIANSAPPYARATIWKNGTQTFIGPSDRYTVMTDVVFANGKVMALGTEWDLAPTNNFLTRIWTDGVASTYTTDCQDPLSLVVEGNDVYVLGYTRSNYRAAYWKNGSKVNELAATPGVFSSPQGRNMVVKGQDVYVAGHENITINTSGVPFARYWKNGVATNLTNPFGERRSYGYDIAVDGSDVYVVGSVDYADSGIRTVATMWKNNTPIRLGTMGSYSEAFRVAIK